MPKISKECCDERKTRIISACRQLYCERNFKDISLKDISALAGCTRTTIYNYFDNKEEIFLGLLECEYYDWTLELKRLKDSPIRPTIETFAEALAHSLEKRVALLKLLATSLYDIEEHSSHEAIVAFKREYKDARETLYTCLVDFFKEFSEKKKLAIVDMFFASLFGIYPFCFVTAKQKDAMQEVKLTYTHYSIYDFSYQSVKMMLSCADD